MASSAGGMKRANQCGQSSLCGPTIGWAGFYSSLPPLHCTSEKSAINSHKFNETPDCQNPRAAAANSQVGHCSLLQSLCPLHTHILLHNLSRWQKMNPVFPWMFCLSYNTWYQKRITLTAISAEDKKWYLHQCAVKSSCYVKQLRILWKKSLASSQAR